VQKIAKNCNFFEKIAQNRGNSAILADFMGHMQVELTHSTRNESAQKLQFFSISGPFCIEFVLELPQNMGH